MALLHGYPLGLFDHPKWTSQVRDEQAFAGAYRTAQSGEQVTGSGRFCNETARTRLVNVARAHVTQEGFRRPCVVPTYAGMQKQTILSLFFIFLLVRTVRSQ